MGLEHTWKYISKSQKGPWCPAALTSSTAQDREGHWAITSNSSSLWDHSLVFQSCGLMVWSPVWDYSLFTDTEEPVSHLHPNQIRTRQLINHSTTQTRGNADKLTRDCVADSDKDPLKICKITPGGLEHVHETIDIKVLHPKNKPK